MNEDFFSSPLEQSKIKSQIVSKYFDAWSRIIGSESQKIRYIDLFAGRGYYEDKTESTPLLILKKAIENLNMRGKLITEFNDKKLNHVEFLTQAVERFDGIGLLKYYPEISNMVVSKEIIEKYDTENQIPSFFFLDPFGYKGVSLDLIKISIKGWASECILFFNYKRINMDLRKRFVDENINELFGKERADRLRSTILRMSPYQREETIIQEFCAALNEMGGDYTLPFCFRDRKQDRTSHYLIHASKHHLGYGLMKEIMDGYSIKDDDGVPTFTFDPKGQLTLNFNQSLKQLAEQLLQHFKGKTIKVKDIYEQHQGKTRFVKRNYKDALIMLEKKDRIKVDVPINERRIIKGKITLGDDRIVEFC